MSERKGTKALELWCRRITDGYPGVKVDNMTTSWRDGLAFCALIHHFRPDLIDFSSLKKEDVYHNNELAFRTAESYLGIPALLDAEDMAQYAVPDRLSILTYLSQYYQHFASTGSSPSRLTGKRSSPSADRSPLPPSPSSSSPPTKMATSLGRREPCVSCGQPVFLAQRLLVDRRLYHRTCFTCARCGAQLSLASCYQTETDGQYCCETCPDEESDPQEDDDINSEETDSVKTGDTSASKGDDRKSNIFRDSEQKNAYNRMLSDEEKVRNVQLFKDALAAEDSAFNQSLREHSVQTSTPSSKALSGFLNTQFHQNSDDDEAPALPSSLPPVIIPLKTSPMSINQSSVSMDLDTYSPAEESVGKVSPIADDESNVYLGLDSAIRQSVSASEATDSEKLKHFNSEKDASVVSVVSVDEKLLELSPAGDKVIIPETHCAASTRDKFNSKSKIESTVKTDIETPKKIDSSSREIRLQNVNIEETHVNQLITASDLKENDSKRRNPRDNFDVSAENADLIAKENQRHVKSDTFDKKNVDGEMSRGTLSPSLVKMRMKLFESVSPEKSRISDIKVSPIGSRKNTVDQDKLVLTNDKLSVRDDIIINSDSNIVGSTANVKNDKLDISIPSIPEIILINDMKTHAEEESQNCEMNVPCNDSTKSTDIAVDSDKEDNLNRKVETTCTATSVEFKEENFVYNNRIDNLEDISESKQMIISDEIMVINREEVTDDIEEKELHNEIISSKERDVEEDVTNIEMAASQPEIQSLIVTTDEDVKESALPENQSSTSVTGVNDGGVKESDLSENQTSIGSTEVNDEDSIKESGLSENQPSIVSTAIFDDSIKESDLSEENQSSIVTTGMFDDSIKDSDLPKNKSTKEVNDEVVEEYPDDLNPFCSDEDEQMPTSVEKKVITPTNRYSLLSHMESTIEVIHSPPQKTSTNPFGSCSEDEDDDEVAKPNVAVKKKSGEKPPRPPPPVILINTMKQNSNTLEMKKIIPATNLNPFDSEDDDISEDDRQNMETPVPTPRQRIGDGQEPHPLPRSSLGSVGPPSFHGSSSSLSSTISRRKKAPAPKPPASGIFDTPVAAPRTINLKPEDVHDTSMGSTLSSHNSSLLISPQLSPRSRKRRPAPAPPTASSTFIDSPSSDYQSLNTSGPIPPRLAVVADELISCSPIVASAEDNKSMSSLSSVRRIISAVEFDEPDPEMISSEDWDSEKLDKEEKKNGEQTNDGKVLSQSYENKSTSGVWKRRKGPAPAVPLLQRRTPTQPLSAAAIRRELTLLEEQQRGLEKQGVRLEEIIRERGEGAPEGTSDPETDELVLQLFELVNEKNELFRRQAELMYIRRQQRLEEEHADLEHQLRCMMARPEANKTDADKAREEQLLQRLLLVVTRRDEVVGALEAERVRERREDQAIRERMAAHRAKLDENSSMSSADSHTSAAKKEKKKDKKKWMKRDKQKKPEDKNVSEETENATVKKEKKIKKWF